MELGLAARTSFGRRFVLDGTKLRKCAAQVGGRCPDASRKPLGLTLQALGVLRVDPVDHSTLQRDHGLEPFDLGDQSCNDGVEMIGCHGGSILPT